MVSLGSFLNNLENVPTEVRNEIDHLLFFQQHEMREKTKYEKIVSGLKKELEEMTRLKVRSDTRGSIARDTVKSSTRKTICLLKDRLKTVRAELQEKRRSEIRLGRQIEFLMSNVKTEKKELIKILLEYVERKVDFIVEKGIVEEEGVQTAGRCNEDKNIKNVGALRHQLEKSINENRELKMKNTMLEEYKERFEVMREEYMNAKRDSAREQEDRRTQNECVKMSHNDTMHDKSGSDREMYSRMNEAIEKIMSAKTQENEMLKSGYVEFVKLNNRVYQLAQYFETVKENIIRGVEYYINRSSLEHSSLMEGNELKQNSLLKENELKYGSLIGTHQELTGKYNELLASHKGLSDKYNELLNSHSELSGKYSELLDSHKDLADRYDQSIESIKHFPEQNDVILEHNPKFDRERIEDLERQLLAYKNDVKTIERQFEEYKRIYASFNIDETQRRMGELEGEIESKDRYIQKQNALISKFRLMKEEYLRLKSEHAK